MSDNSAGWPRPPLMDVDLPSNFETLQRAREIDEKNAAALRRCTWPGAADLADIIQPPRLPVPYGEPTLASACYFRVVRIRFLRWAMQVLKPYTDADIAMVTLIPNWTAPFGTLAEFPLDQKLDGFAMQLRRAGVTAMPGPLVAAVHGEYDGTFHVYRLHLHVLATIEKATHIRSSMKKHPAFEATKFTHLPVQLNRADYRGRGGLITYLTKPFIPTRNSYQVDDEKWSRGRPQPLRGEPLAEVLTWFDGLRLSKLLHTNKVNLPHQLGAL